MADLPAVVQKETNQLRNRKAKAPAPPVEEEEILELLSSEEDSFW
jgi:hypothetical protein